MPRRRKTAGTAPGYRHVELGFISEWGEGGGESGGGGDFGRFWEDGGIVGLRVV